MKNLTLLFLFLTFCSVSSQEKIKDTVKLKEVEIKSERKAVEQKADRTIFDFASQAHLNSGSVMEGLKKLPGLIVSDVAGMMYQGKLLDVYLDGRPLNISSNELNAFLEGMPANNIEKVEVITQPGAEFPATSGGAIINIVTSKKAKNYLSATYSNNLYFTSYDRTRTRTNNSLLLSSKNKYFGWQFNVGQSYRESALWSDVSSDPLIISDSDAHRINRNNYLRSALTFDIGKDRLLLNYDLNYIKNTTNTLARGFGFESLDEGKSKILRQDAVATYQKRFDNKDKKLDLRLNFSRNDTDFNLNSLLSNSNVLQNNALQDYVNFRADYSQPIKILDEGKMSFGTWLDNLSFETESFGTTNLDYDRRTLAGYFELQATYKKFDFILGSRAEDYSITGTTFNADLIPFKQLRFFPNATVQYNIAPQIFFNLNYNKKITLPSTSVLNPNNTNYQNPNINFSGNPFLQPTIFDNFEAKISAFDYAYIGYNVSSVSNQVANRLFLNGADVFNTSVNIPDMRIHNFNIGLPLPYMLFTKGLKETMKFDFNPDKINFLYLYVGYQMHEVPGLNTKAFWNFNLMSQIVLPMDIKFITEFNTSTTGGNYFYFVATEPFGNSLDFNLSKKFLNDRLTVSVDFDDVFNSNKQGFRAVDVPLLSENKYDTRRFGFSINYKIPTRNKLAKEDPNLLNKEKKEETGSVN
jgi:Outer membrane protein beta-barrel family